MNRIVFFAFLVLSYSSTFAQELDDDDDFGEKYTRFAGERHTEFEFTLLKKILEKQSGNVVVSPLLVKMLLSLIGSAASFDVDQEISALLPKLQSEEDIQSYYKKVLESLKTENENYKLNVGSKIFLDFAGRPQKSFGDLAKRVYGASVKRLDFNNPSEVVGVVNNWASNVTEGKIENLVTEDNIENGLAILANAIYFQGTWSHMFPEEVTTNYDFSITDDKIVSVPFMIQDAAYYHGESAELDARILRMAYKGEKFSMSILLPNQVNGLNQLVEKITPAHLRDLQFNMRVSEMSIIIPKFTIKYEEKLRHTLEKIGIKKLFTTRNFPALSKQSIGISEVLQKAVIEVNEKGTSAAAATLGLIFKSFGPPPFHANRPFLYIIEDETTGAILFAGKVTDPSK